MQITQQQYDEMRVKIMREFMKRGFKAVTMDSIASVLGISKRTLYEIFESKDHMICEAFAHMGKINAQEMSDIIENAPNMMVALFNVFAFKLAEIKEVSIEFYEDMDVLIPTIRERYKVGEDQMFNRMRLVFERGIEEGVFRNDIKCLVLFRMLFVQFEALKRMDASFFKEFTLNEIVLSILMGFLQSIASPKGFEIIEKERNILLDMKLCFLPQNDKN